MMERRTYPGPPGYGESPDDIPETGFYIVPEVPLCMDGSDHLGNRPQSGIRLVQLVLDSAGYARSQPMLGTRVQASGTLFGAFTGHHHAPLLMNRPQIEPWSKDTASGGAASELR